MILSPQKKLILSFCSGLIVLLLFIWLAIYPLVDKVRTVSQEYLSNQEILNKLDQRESLAKELEESYQERKVDLEAIARVLLGSEEIVGFISNMETIAQKTDNYFEIKAVSPYTPLTEEEKAFLNFRIFLWGDFPGLLSFLANLEDSPYPPYRLVEIDNLTIRKLTRASLAQFDLKESDLETILDVKIYTQ